MAHQYIPKIFHDPRKFRNIHRKTLVLESLFNKVAGIQV